MNIPTDEQVRVVGRALFDHEWDGAESPIPYDKAIERPHWEGVARAALIAFLATPEMRQVVEEAGRYKWQPIATAPDYEAVLLYERIMLDDGPKHFIDVGCMVDGRLVNIDGMYPTLWMPLPPPPVDAAIARRDGET